MSDVMDKIRKLLALGQSSNENEAKAAILRAKDLMAKHKISSVDLGDVKDQKVVQHVCGIKWTTDSGEIWMTEVAKAIAPHYCCEVAWRTPRGCRTHTMVAIGFEEDAKLFETVMEFAAGFMRRRVRILTRKNPYEDPQSVATSYAKGFATGVEAALKEQENENPEWGLVVVTPKEAVDYFNSLGSKSVRTGATHHVSDAYGKGFEDGKKFDPSTKIGGEHNE